LLCLEPIDRLDQCRRTDAEIAMPPIVVDAIRRMSLMLIPAFQN